LTLVVKGVVAAVDFNLLTKIVFDFVLSVGAQILASCNVLQQHWFTSFNYFTLHFKAYRWVNVFNQPN
jgi:hypothetical protein